MPRQLADLQHLHTADDTPVRMNFELPASLRALFVARCRAEAKSASQILRDLIARDVSQPDLAAGIVQHLLASAQAGDAESGAVLTQLRDELNRVPA